MGGAVSVRVIAGYSLVNLDSGWEGVSDPYVRVHAGSTMKRTETINNDLDPRWNATPFIFPVKTADAVMQLEVWDADWTKDEWMGCVKVTSREVANTGGCEMVIRRALEGVPGGGGGELEFAMSY